MQVEEIGKEQAKLLEIVWKNEPIGSGNLVKKCNDELGWKKSTTYTVLRVLCKKGLLLNQDSTITALVSRDKYYFDKSVHFMDDAYNGSLPAFISAFSSARKLTPEEINALQQIIDEYRKGDD